MKGLLFSAVGLCVFVSLAPVRPAHAQSVHRVVMETFTGAGAPRLRQQTISALVRLGQKVLPDRNVTMTAKKLNIAQLSENYPAVARDVNATLFVEGSIVANGRRAYEAKIKLKNSDGVVAREAEWAGTSPADVLKKVQGGMFLRLKGLISEVPVAPPTAVEPFSQGQAASSAPAAPPPLDPLAAGTTPASTPAEAPAEPPPTAAPIAVASINDENDDVERGPPDGEAPPGLIAAAESERQRRMKPNRLDISVGTQLFARNFVYVENRVGPQQNYQVLGVPSPNIAIDYFPISYLGLSVSGEYSVPVSSRDADGKRYRTGSYGYTAAAKLRFIFRRLDLIANAGYGENRFAIAKDNSPTAPQVANVTYPQIKTGGAARVRLGNRLALIGGGNYLYLLGVGELKTYFPYVTGNGAEGFAGVAYRAFSYFELRATGHARAYFFNMNTLAGDPREASGAVDRYLGVNLAIAFRD
jgi:hypothetical protein